MTACNQTPPPPTPTSAPTAECDPVPVTPPPLPDFVESITYQGREIHGPIQSIHAAGDMVFMAVGDTFAILDVSNAAEPQIVGSLPLKKGYYLSEISAFSVQNNLAYFMWEHKNFTVDISNASEPVQVECTSAVPWPDVTEHFRGRYQINKNSAGQIVIEEKITNGSAPPMEDAIITIGTAPKIEWNYPPGQLIPLPTYIKSEPMPIAGNGYTFDDRYLYLVNGIEVLKNGAFCCGRLTIFDLKNPSNPKQVGTIEINDNFFIPFSVKTYEDFLFVSVVSGNEGYTLIYDIQDKGNPVELVSVPGRNMPYFHNGYVYFVRRPSNPTDFEVWSLIGEDGPKFVKQLKIPENRKNFWQSSNDYQLVFQDDYIYLANGETLEILDNTDPLNVSLVNRIQFPSISVPLHLSITDNFIAAITERDLYSYIVEFIAMNEHWQEADWNVLIEDPSGSYADMAIEDDNFFMVDTPTSALTRLNGYDMSEPVGSNIVSVLEIEDKNYYGTRMAANFPYLYIIENTPSDGLIILDVSDPDNPLYIAEIVLDTAAFSDLTVWENNLFLTSSTGEDDIWQFDISNPIKPQFIARYPTSYLDNITAGDGFLFALNDERQLVINDLRQPEAPKFVGTFDIENEAARDIFYQDGVLWMALGQRGLAAVRLNLEKIPQPECRIQIPINLLYLPFASYTGFSTYITKLFQRTVEPHLTFRLPEGLQ